MQQPTLSVRPLRAADIDSIAAYWLSASADYLRGMGADPALLPARSDWEAMLQQQLRADFPEKKAYCLIWEADGQAVGHCNVNNITFGQEAYMHLHLWQPGTRQQGYGTALVRLTLPHFFRDLQLERLYSEPYAHNAAPHKVLEKAGFTFVKEYVTVPGSINFEQPVKRWEISREQVEPHNS